MKKRDLIKRNLLGFTCAKRRDGYLIPASHKIFFDAAKISSMKSLYHDRRDDDEHDLDFYELLFNSGHVELICVPRFMELHLDIWPIEDEM